ncbi:hypothetical protein K469DRAFT_783903 [Zopfia rhizophila CBS 207.26]|uniref:Uncharacterized protein n=1 Tax=Zopfia rhizophila CBS 207.26 TaxID=1314779 RepID=A0A6A6E0S8_9PEZI|nr:hypothetical protein K469DRAFT_783903 [Zopfia rhizophila CBS 207.26]
MSARTLRQLKPSPSCRHSRPKADTVTQSGSLRTYSPGTGLVHDCSIDYAPDDHVDYWMTNISLGQVLKLTSDSWLPVGCGYNYHDAPNVRAGRGWTQPRNDYARGKIDTCSPHGKGTSYDGVDSNSECNGDDDFEDCGESSGSERSSDSDSDAGFDDDDNGGGPRHTRVRALKPWSKSDEQRLLAYRRKMVWNRTIFFSVSQIV